MRKFVFLGWLVFPVQDANINNEVCSLEGTFCFCLTATSILRLTRSESSDLKSELAVFLVILKA